MFVTPNMVSGAAWRPEDERSAALLQPVLDERELVDAHALALEQVVVRDRLVVAGQNFTGWEPVVTRPFSFSFRYCHSTILLKWGSSEVHSRPQSIE